MTGRVSPHFTWEEFACNDGTPYPEEWRDTRGFELAGVLEDIRAALGGGPLTVGSVYRTPSWNALKKGKPASRHLQGRAGDCYPPRPPGHRKRMAMPIFHRRVHALAKADPRIGGLGFYKWGVHLDTRTRMNGRLVVWNKVAVGTPMHDGPAPKEMT